MTLNCDPVEPAPGTDDESGAPAFPGDGSGQSQGHVSIYCPICASTSPESEKRVREIARLGLARFLSIARKASVNITIDQQREILEALLTWESAGLPGEVDWLVHEHADRAVHFAVMGLDVDPRLYEAAASIPPWDANVGDSVVWDCEAERRVAEQLKAAINN